MAMIQAEQVSYTYKTKYQKVEAVKAVSCSFELGKLYAITGESGSGKSTFLSLLAGLDLATSGKLYVDGKDMEFIDRDRYRRELASVVYQAFHLFPLLNALENVMIPMELKGIRKKEAAKFAKELLQKVGLPDRVANQFPHMMSGGEQQRVAIARAMAAGGKILLADEPTGSLDSKNESGLIKIFKELAHKEGYLVIIVTHNHEVATAADTVYQFKDGELVRGEAYVSK